MPCEDCSIAGWQEQRAAWGEGVPSTEGNPLALYPQNATRYPIRYGRRRALPHQGQPTSSQSCAGRVGP